MAIKYKSGSSWVDIRTQIFPVGSIYMSMTSTSPSSLFGGTWSAITGRFLYCNAGTSTGGSNSHTHDLSTGAAMIDFMAVAYARLVIAKNNSSYKWNSGSVGMPDGSRQVTGSSGPGSDDFAGGSLTKLYGNSGASSNMPAYQTIYCWRRTA